MIRAREGGLFDAEPAGIGSLENDRLLNANATMHCDTSCFHNCVAVYRRLSCVPGIYFLQRPPQRECEFFVARFKGTISTVAQDFCSFFLSGAAVINDVLRNLL